MLQIKDKNRKLIWLKKFNEKKMSIKRQISQITKEIRRVKRNKSLTKNMRKKRTYMRREIVGKINLKKLVALKEKKVNRLRRVIRERKDEKQLHVRSRPRANF